MIGLIRHLPSTLRASLLVLLVLGLIIKPVLSQISELHAVEHAAFAMANAAQDGDHDHGHQHHHDHDDVAPEGSPSGNPDEEHGKGAHGLMHQANVGASLDVASDLLVVPFVPPMTVLPMPKTSSVPLQNLATPFRPPIA